MTRLAYSVSSEKSRLIVLILISVLAWTGGSGLAIQSDRTSTFADPKKPGIEIFSASAQEALARIQERRKLVNESKHLYEKGDLDNAERGLMASLSRDGQDSDVRHYLTLISKARNNLRQSKEPVPFYPWEGMKVIDRIRIDSIAFNDLSLDEVMKILAVEAKKCDPLGRGIIFRWQPMFFREDPEVAVRVNLPLELTNITVRQLLDFIVKFANVPISYRVEESIVVFSHKTDDLPPLYVRVFKIEEPLFDAALHVEPPKVLPSPQDHDPGSFQRFAAMTRVFEEIGVDWKPPKSWFYSPSRCDLIVRATAADLEKIENYLEGLKLAAIQEGVR